MAWLIRKIILLFSGETSSRQLAVGASFGLLLSFVPPDSLVFASLCLVLLALRINISMSIAFYILGWVLWLPLAASLNMLGEGLLKAEALQGLWTAAYNTPIIAISGFNRPAVMGGFCAGLIIAIILYPILDLLIIKYRKHIVARLEKLWLIKAIKGSSLYRIYSSLVG